MVWGEDISYVWLQGCASFHGVPVPHDPATHNFPLQYDYQNFVLIYVFLISFH